MPILASPGGFGWADGLRPRRRRIRQTGSLSFRLLPGRLAIDQATDRPGINGDSKPLSTTYAPIKRCIAVSDRADQQGCR